MVRALVYLDTGELVDRILWCFEKHWGEDRQNAMGKILLCVSNVLEAYVQARLVEPVKIDPEALARALRFKLNAQEVELRG